MSSPMQTASAFGTPAQRGYALALLTVVYTLSSMDRLLLGVVAQPIIEDFQLKDWEFGLLSGFGFMVTYTVAGIPIARLVETRNRLRIIAICLFIWSVMTMLCGFAWGFLSILIFRIGVSLGEAGCVPPANSLIGDYYPARSRAKAIAIFGLGVPLGGIIANLLGGPITDALSWRETFMIFAVPGIPVALLLWFTAKEPPRGYSEEPGTAHETGDSFIQTARKLLKKRTFWWITVASLLCSMTGSGLANFQAPLFQRLHGISVGDAAIFFVFPMSIGAAVGSFSAGWLTEKFSPRYPNIVTWLPGIGLMLSVPCYFVSLTSEAIAPAVAAHALGATLMYTYLGNQYAIVQAISAPRSRATAVALFLLLNNLLGSGLGPLVTGAISDFVAGVQLAGADLTGQLAVSQCKGTVEDLLDRLGPELTELCRLANREGLQRALLAMVALAAPAGLAFIYTRRYLQRELISRFA